MINQPQVVCIGDSCVDVYIEPVNSTFLGGNAVNTAVAIRKTGLLASYAGAVGNDPAGKALLQRLRARQINTRYVRVHSAPTNRSHTQLLPDGEHEYLHALNAPRLPLAFSVAEIEELVRHKILHANWLWPQFAAIPAFRLIPELIVSIDYGPCVTGEFLDRTLPFAKLAFFSVPEAQADQAPALAESMFRRGPRVVVVTMGSRGSLVYDGQLHRQAAEPVKVVDTLGAGDALIGTFIGSYLNGLSVESALLAGARAAASACSILGAWTGASLDGGQSAEETNKA